MNIVDRLRPPVFASYVAWAIVLLIHALLVSAQSEWLATLPSDTSHSLMIMFWVVLGSLMVLGAVLAWFTQARRSWARWLFMFLCFVYAVDCLLGTLAIGPIYDSMSRPYGMFRGPISFVMWAYLLWLAWSTRPTTAVTRAAPQAARPLP
jgi:hypothetical protein